jgi:superoxide dismutase, Cu-Zn family
MHRLFTLAAAGLFAAGLAVAAPTASSDKSGAPRTAADEKAVATAKVEGAGDMKGKIHGTVTFTQMGTGVMVLADITGLPPGKHGFHIHDKPDVSSADLMSAGGHWNPDNHKHGGPNSPEHHAGDLGNLEADSSGHAHLDHMFEGITVNGHNPVVGHSVIIHEKADDEKSQPAGDAGKRIAGGVIKGSEGGEHHEH